MFLLRGAASALHAIAYPGVSKGPEASKGVVFAQLIGAKDDGDREKIVRAWLNSGNRIDDVIGNFHGDDVNFMDMAVIENKYHFAKFLKEIGAAVSPKNLWAHHLTEEMKTELGLELRVVLTEASEKGVAGDVFVFGIEMSHENDVDDWAKSIHQLAEHLINKQKRYDCCKGIYQTSGCEPRFHGIARALMDHLFPVLRRSSNASNLPYARGLGLAYCTIVDIACATFTSPQKLYIKEMLDSLKPALGWLQWSDNAYQTLYWEQNGEFHQAFGKLKLKLDVLPEPPPPTRESDTGCGGTYNM